MTNSISCANCLKEIQRSQAHVHETDESDTHQTDHGFCQSCVALIRNSTCPVCNLSLEGKNITPLAVRNPISQPQAPRPNVFVNADIAENYCSFAEACFGCVTPAILLIIMLAIDFILKERSKGFHSLV